MAKEIYCPQTYRVNKEYPIYLGRNILGQLIDKIRPFKPNKVFLISDTHVAALHGSKVLMMLSQNFETFMFKVPAGEENKTFQQYISLCDNLISCGITKRSFIIILGGGVVGNLVGFAASTIMRGIDFAHLPTTVMAQVDSTTGGKQAVNMPQGKNLLGVFNDPKFIFIDTDFLHTLPQREFSCGFAECIKHALCQDEDFANELLLKFNKEHQYSDSDLLSIVERTVKLKIDLLKMDPKEINEGKILVYGHTVGHAVETLSRGKLNHGESISIGMMFAAKASVSLGFADQSLLQAHEQILTKAGLPTKIPDYIQMNDIVAQLNYDKKLSLKIELILLRRIGEPQAQEGRIGCPLDKEKMLELLTDRQLLTFLQGKHTIQPLSNNLDSSSFYQ